MNTLRTLVATLAGLALAGTAWAQNDTRTPGTAGGAASGTMSNDTNGSTTMPAEVVPDSVSGSGTREAAPSIPDQHIPTRNEVKAEAASLVRAGLIPHGELSTAHQDKGAEIGSTPY